MSIQTRIRKLEKDIGIDSNDLSLLSDDELELRLSGVCRSVIEHPDASDEERLEAQATLDGQNTK